MTWYFADEMYINEFVRYRTARSKYFAGIYETIRNDGNLNAIELFFSMIYKDSKIQSLASDRVFQIQLQITRGTQSASDFEKVISGVQRNMGLVRRDSGFFLAQCHFDLGNYSTATNWLTRLEEIEDTQRWQASINYLRGRSLEAQRDYDSALAAFNNQESEQFHGDLIRGRLLKKITGAAEQADDSTSKPTDNKTDTPAELSTESNSQPEDSDNKGSEGSDDKDSPDSTE